MVPEQEGGNNLEGKEGRNNLEGRVSGVAKELAQKFLQDIGPKERENLERLAQEAKNKLNEELKAIDEVLAKIGLIKSNPTFDRLGDDEQKEVNQMCEKYLKRKDEIKAILGAE